VAETIAAISMGVESSNSEGSLKSRFNSLDAKRTQVLERGRQCSGLTIPALLPPAGFSEDQELITPYQGTGAWAVNNLASKIVLAHLAPNTPFFKETLDVKAAQELKDETEVLDQINSTFAVIERATLQEIEEQALRVPYLLTIKYLIVCGYALLYLPDEGGAISYRPDQFVVVRDPMGDVLELIIRERIHVSLLPPEVQATAVTKAARDDQTVEMYTQVKRKKRLWYVVQEVCEELIESSRGTYPLDECPWIAPRWSTVAGEHYGRGHVDEYIGDIRSAESLTQSIVEGTAAAAKVLFLNNPNGTTNSKKVSQAKNGDIISGNATDITTLQVQKYNDFKVALDTLERLTRAIEQAFLLMASVQRNAERVTAEEFRSMASELDSALGGVYSLLSATLQLPLLRRIQARMRKQGKLPQLPSKFVKPVITTGIDALSRSFELSRIEQFLAGLPPEALKRIKWEVYLKRRATALNVDVEGMVMTDAEYSQMQQQETLMSIAQGAAPGAIQELTKGAMNSGTGANPEAAQGTEAGA